MVVNYRTPDQLARCLASVPERHRRTTTVVDNGSCELTTALLEGHFPWANLIVPGTNLGFGQGVHAALRRSNAQAALVLNADTELRDDTVDVLEEYLRSHPRCAVVGPRIVGDDGRLQPSCLPWPSPVDYLCAELRVFDLLRRIGLRSTRFLRLWDHATPREVPWVLGCAFAIRRSAYDEVGGFDPAFFLYFEEVDLCFRLRDAGWSIQFIPATEVKHTGGASTDGRRAAMRRAFYGSMHLWYRLHAPDRLGHLRMAVLASFVPMSAKAAPAALIGGRRRTQARANLTLFRQLAPEVWRWRGHEIVTDRSREKAPDSAASRNRPGLATRPTEERPQASEPR